MIVMKFGGTSVESAQAGIVKDGADRKPSAETAEADRPQPRKDADRDRGMFFDWKFAPRDSNIRGAAGVAVLNAELLHAELTS